jgi:hypothetical protein
VTHPSLTALLQQFPYLAGSGTGAARAAGDVHAERLALVFGREGRCVWVRCGWVSPAWGCLPSLWDEMVMLFGKKVMLFGKKVMLFGKKVMRFGKKVMLFGKKVMLFGMSWTCMA